MSDTAPRLTRRIAAFSAILLLGGGGAWGYFEVRQIYDASGPLPSATNIVITRGNVQMIIARLRGAHLLKSDWMTGEVFRYFVRLTRRRGALRSGEYAFPARASMRQVIAILRYDKPVQHFITIPEGLTALQIRALLETAPALKGDVPELGEGEVLPQTLSYRYGDQRSQIVERFHHLMENALKKTWDGRDPSLGLQSPRELLILASMVERESGREDERARVARVFLNRLKLGMKLQSDPTVIYDVSQGMGVLPHPLTRAELRFNLGHNTYVLEGLPSGPICAPGYATLMAVAHAPPSDELYFVAKGDGTHVFSSSLKAHNAEIRRHRHHALHPETEAPPAD